MLSANLVKKQHVLPKKSIERFCNQNGLVQVYLVDKKTHFPAKPSNQIFCVHQFWDQRAEHGYGKSIEDKYQRVVERVIASDSRELSLAENETLTEFYALWCFRTSVGNYIEQMSGKLDAVTTGQLSDQEKIEIELNHSFYVEPDGYVPIRFKRGLSIEMAINCFTVRNRNLNWHVVKSQTFEFIVSDNPVGDCLIPFTPTHSFSCVADGPNLTEIEMGKINLRAIMRSKHYYFARNLGAVLF